MSSHFRQHENKTLSMQMGRKVKKACTNLKDCTDRKKKKKVTSFKKLASSLELRWRIKQTSIINNLWSVPDQKTEPTKAKHTFFRELLTSHRGCHWQEAPVTANASSRVPQTNALQFEKQAKFKRRMLNILGGARKCSFTQSNIQE